MGNSVMLPAGEKSPAQVSALPEFLGGDIVLFAGQGDLYSRLSRWLMRTNGEGATYAVHSAQFLDGGSYLELDIVGKIKPTRDIFKRRMKLDMWTRRGFTVWRLRHLSTADRDALTAKALDYLNARFGMAKFLTHLLDGVLNKLTGRDLYFFRRLNHDQRYPICSWITAFSYDRALAYRFGVPPECADPDQIDDWVHAHPTDWVCVYRLDGYADK